MGKTQAQPIWTAFNHEDGSYPLFDRLSTIEETQTHKLHEIGFQPLRRLKHKLYGRFSTIEKTQT